MEREKKCRFKIYFELEIRAVIAIETDDFDGVSDFRAEHKINAWKYIYIGFQLHVYRDTILDTKFDRENPEKMYFVCRHLLIVRVRVRCGTIRAMKISFQQFTEIVSDPRKNLLRYTSHVQNAEFSERMRTNAHEAIQRNSGVGWINNRNIDRVCWRIYSTDTRPRVLLADHIRIFARKSAKVTQLISPAGSENSPTRVRRTTPSKLKIWKKKK